MLAKFGSAVLVASVALLAGNAWANHHEAPAKSLYDRLGGLAPISVVVSDFIDLAVADAELNKNPNVAKTRETAPAAYLKYHVTAMVCQASGGPCQYQGKTMQDSHTHLKITEKEWDRMLVLFVQVLKKHKVGAKEQEELVNLISATKADIVVPAASSTK